MNIVPGRFLRAKDIYRPHGLLPISRSLFYLLISKGEFPRGIRIAPSTVIWAEDAVIAWISERGDRFAGLHRAAALDLGARQQMGTETNRSLARQRWANLADEFGRSGMVLKDFAERRCDTGEEPFTYRTRDGSTRTYPFEAIMRGVRKVLKERQRERT